MNIFMSACISLIIITYVTSNSPSKNLPIEEALKLYLSQKLKEPTAYADGTIPTLNNMGSQNPVVDKITGAFINFSVSSSHVLEIGPCYGFAFCKTMTQSSMLKEYAAIDCDENHLSILAHNAQQVCPDRMDALRLFVCRFPNISLPKNYYDAILMARVLHFMRPEELDITIASLYSALKPEGRIFISTISPYSKGYAPFASEYEKRKNYGHSCPGFVEQKKEWASPNLPPAVVNNMSGSLLFFDTEFMQSLFEKHGFLIELCDYIPFEMESEAWKLDGREYVGLIAKKPALSA